MNSETLPTLKALFLSMGFRVFLLCLLTGGLVENALAAAPPRPNIVLLMGDDHGWEETGHNGHPYLKTPTLDAMATSSLRMDRFYAAHPSCSPTRGSVLTGRHPSRYGTFYPGDQRSVGLCRR